LRHSVKKLKKNIKITKI